MEKPFKVQTMHFHHVSQHGVTLFSPLKEVVEGLPPSVRSTWERLYFVADNGRVHPLVCRHPETDCVTMCFHCGEPFVRAFAEAEAGGESLRMYPWSATLDVLAEIKRELENPKWVFELEWELGDLAIIDNLAVAHYAHADTQADPSMVGLRVLHRTTIAGDHAPLAWSSQS